MFVDTARSSAWTQSQTYKIWSVCKKEDICPNHQAAWFPWTQTLKPHGLLANLTSLSHSLHITKLLSLLSFFSPTLSSHLFLNLWPLFCWKREIIIQARFERWKIKETWVLVQKLGIATMITPLRFCWLVILVLERVVFSSASYPTLTLFMIFPPQLVRFFSSLSLFFLLCFDSQLWEFEFVDWENISLCY